MRQPCLVATDSVAVAVEMMRVGSRDEEGRDPERCEVGSSRQSGGNAGMHAPESLESHVGVGGLNTFDAASLSAWNAPSDSKRKKRIATIRATARTPTSTAVSVVVCPLSSRQADPGGGSTRAMVRRAPGLAREPADVSFRRPGACVGHGDTSLPSCRPISSASSCRCGRAAPLGESRDVTAFGNQPARP